MKKKTLLFLLTFCYLTINVDLQKVEIGQPQVDKIDFEKIQIPAEPNVYSDVLSADKNLLQENQQDEKLVDGLNPKQYDEFNVNNDQINQENEGDDGNDDDCDDESQIKNPNIEYAESSENAQKDSNPLENANLEVKFDGWIVQEVIIDSDSNGVRPSNDNSIDIDHYLGNDIVRPGKLDRNLEKELNVMHMINQQDDIDYLKRKINRIEALVWWTLQLLVVLSLFLMVCHFLTLLAAASQRVKFFYVKPKQTNTEVKRDDCCEKRPLIDV